MESITKKASLYGHGLGSAIGLLCRGNLFIVPADKLIYPYHGGIKGYDANSCTFISMWYKIQLEYDTINTEMVKLKCNLSQAYRSIILNPQFKKNPIENARIHWDESNHTFAPNVTIGYTLALAFRKLNEDDAMMEILEKVKNSCCMISPDPRCIIACWHAVMAMRIRCKRNKIPDHETIFERLKPLIAKLGNFTTSQSGLHLSNEYWYSSAYVTKDGSYDYISEYVDCFRNSTKCQSIMQVNTIYGLNIQPFSYVFKTFGLFCWLITQPELKFLDIVNGVASFGGDSDINAAVAGCIVGAIGKMDCIPKTHIIRELNIEY